MGEVVLEKCSSTAEFDNSVPPKYRYSLKRIWDDSLPRVVFVLLNPSSAGAAEGDPTSDFCVSFARHQKGIGGVEIVNLFARIASDPKELWKLLKRSEEIVGLENNDELKRIGKKENIESIIFGWGSGCNKSMKKAIQERINGLKLEDWPNRSKCRCFKLPNDDGPATPIHPLRFKIKYGEQRNKDDTRKIKPVGELTLEDLCEMPIVQGN